MVPGRLPGSVRALAPPSLSVLAAQWRSHRNPPTPRYKEGLSVNLGARPLLIQRDTTCCPHQHPIAEAGAIKSEMWP